MIKIQKLTNQMNKNGTGIGKWDFTSEKDDKESGEFIKDLKTHIHQLNHNNSALKTKLQFFRTLYEAESKKKGAYAHIPPRVETVTF